MVWKGETNFITVIDKIINISNWKNIQSWLWVHIIIAFTNISINILREIRKIDQGGGYIEDVSQIELNRMIKIKV